MSRVNCLEQADLTFSDPTKHIPSNSLFVYKATTLSQSLLTFGSDARHPLFGKLIKTQY